MSAEVQPHLQLREVSVEGLDAEAAANAEREVRSQFELIRRYDITLRESAEVMVQVTGNVAAAVNRFNEEQGISAPPYGRSRVEGESAGIVLTAPGNAKPNRHVIVIDATLWSVQSNWHAVHRTHGLAYLLGFLLNHYDSNGSVPDPPAFDGAHARGLWHNSLALCAAWDDAVTAFDLCNVILTDSSGKPVQLSDHLGGDCLQGVSELLDQLCVFSTFDVAFYRVFAIDLEDLYPTAMTLGCVLTRTTIGLISLFGMDGQLEQVKKVLSAMNGFSEFLEPIWDRIVDGCVLERQEQRIEAFSIALTDLLHRLGLRIEDLENGQMYLHVHDPVRCSWAEQDTAAS